MPDPEPIVTDQVEAAAAAIGTNIRALRESLGMSLEQLADSAGTSRQRIARIEDARVNATIATLMPIADALGVGLQDLVPGGSGAASHAARVKARLDELRSEVEAAEAAGRTRAEQARLEADAELREVYDARVKQLEEALREERKVLARVRRTAAKLVSDLEAANP